MRILQKFTFLFLLFIPTLLFGQSISGNMTTLNSSKSLGYGTVNVFKGEKKVASILTDASGHFNVKLDTGYYRLEFKYVGHESLTKRIHVTGDETGKFSLAKDKTFKAPKHFEHSSRKEALNDKASSAAYRKKSVAESVVVSRFEERLVSPTSSSNQSASGLLTAGEVNDFAKWKRWTDIVIQKLGNFKKEWNLFVDQRYTVQLKNKKGIPIVDATVQLLDKNKKVQFIGRTDNTGKTELWGKVGLNDQEMNQPTAQILYQNRSYTIQHLTPIKKGINSFTINAECGASDNVDIAFVVDATGSMSDEINYLKKDLQDVIYRSKNDFPKLSFRFANVFYRDHHDQYITKRQPFTDVLSTSIDFIRRQNAAGGGDRPEVPDEALNVALDSLQWSKNARTRIIFLVLDAPPHKNSTVLASLKDIIHKVAAMGIRIIPIAASGTDKSTEYLMRNLALGTNGTYTFLTNDSGIGNKHIQPTTDHYTVESFNDLLIRLIKTYSYVPRCDGKENDNKIELPLFSDSLVKIKWNVWPNPTQGQFQVKIRENIPELFITDITGKILMRFTDIKRREPLSIDLKIVPKGIYLVTFSYKNQKYTKKIIKI